VTDLKQARLRLAVVQQMLARVLCGFDRTAIVDGAVSLGLFETDRRQLFRRKTAS
jgi:hypothetical protein